jgi:hypothetical protein
MPTPPTPEPGVACTRCDNIIWLAGETPAFIKVTLAGITKCPLAPEPAPNGVWILSQMDGQPCRYDCNLADWRISVYFDSGDTEVGAVFYAPTKTWVYFAANGGECETDFTNYWNTCFSNIGGIGGTAKVELL